VIGIQGYAMKPPEILKQEKTKNNRPDVKQEIPGIMKWKIIKYQNH
jgi:hypothetical protein